MSNSSSVLDEAAKNLEAERAKTVRSAKIALFIICFAWIVIIIFLLYERIQRQKDSKKGACQKAEVTYQPVVPKWLKKDLSYHITQVIRGIRITSRWNFLHHLSHGNRTSHSGSSHVQGWLQNLIDKKFGLPKIQLPLDTCLVSVPMEGFQCGQTCTEFVPDVEGKGGCLMYEVCGEEQVTQLTWYVIGDKVQIAGYCIYMEKPTDPAIWYWQGHIEKFTKPNVRRRNVIEAIV